MEYIFLFFGIISVAIAVVGVILVPVLRLIVAIVTTGTLVMRDIKDINRK